MFYFNCQLSTEESQRLSAYIHTDFVDNLNAYDATRLGDV